jgi:acyl-CoA thioester hydrolase
MFSHTFHSRVRYAETDKMGYLYYGRYAVYYEIGRVEAMRSLGITYQEMEDDWKIAMPVMSLQVRYIRPAYYDDLLEIKSMIRKLPEQSILFHTEIFNSKQELINTAEVKLCFISVESGLRLPAPTLLVEKLKPYFED